MRIDSFGRCTWCGKQVYSTGGCIDCSSSLTYIPPTCTMIDGEWVWDHGWYGPTKWLPEKYRPLGGSDGVQSFFGDEGQK